MGVNLRDLISDNVKMEVEIEFFRGKSLAIDAYNALYQFLSIIRQPNGTPLKDHLGRVTSHLSGLFYRTVNFIEAGLKPIYIFDGVPPEIKEMEISKRRRLKEEATVKYEKALREGDLEAARIYAQQTAQMTEEMVSDAKRLLDAMGIPWIQAPSEGEAQAAHLARKGDAWAAVSQDYDSLLFGAPKLIRNLTISGRRKLPRRKEYVEIKPEIIYLEKFLNELEITREQLIEIAILIGTDYNPDGIKGVGPKTALQLIRKYGKLEEAIKVLGERAKFPVDPAKIKKFFLNPKVTDEYRLEWRMPEREKVIEILCEEHDFSQTRVDKALERALKSFEKQSKQTSLEKWFKN
ncbi:MAG: flap endonuclease-1 [archaeon GB-1845-036]|nr:flap endonuclease-1 [Candidatus Culexmicrobium thermophilum]HDO21067.1 flap endonuclease-1 [Candidatus Bathyarchaeota archaeon]